MLSTNSEDFRSLNYRSCRALFPRAPRNANRLILIETLFKLPAISSQMCMRHSQRIDSQIPTPSGTIEAIESRIIRRLYENMADILCQRCTGVNVLVYIDNQPNISSALYQLDSLAHVNPHLRILEIGAPRFALKALTGHDSVKRYREYVFTDVSSGF
ncbi:hypothetical protein F4860DRAFT_508009 [Xylaria cubensis]|nr:hypothetical protein F4860DRAFT_508009 [Xylaria cubensis]